MFSFYIPVYSFWHFDDFSWGNTRVVLDSGKKLVYAPDVKAFDPNSIILRKWSENASSEKEDSIKSYRSELPPHYASSVKSAGVTRYSIPSNYTPSIMSVTQRPQPVYEHNTPSIPSDDELVFEIKRILSTSDLMAITKKKVREELQVVFKTDLSFKRDFINAAIAEYLSTRS